MVELLRRLIWDGDFALRAVRGGGIFFAMLVIGGAFADVPVLGDYLGGTFAKGLAAAVGGAGAMLSGGTGSRS